MRRLAPSRTACRRIAGRPGDPCRSRTRLKAWIGRIYCTSSLEAPFFFSRPAPSAGAGVVARGCRTTTPAFFSRARLALVVMRDGPGRYPRLVGGNLSLLGWAWSCSRHPARRGPRQLDCDLFRGAIVSWWRSDLKEPRAFRSDCRAFEPRCVHASRTPDPRWSRQIEYQHLGVTERAGKPNQPCPSLTGFFLTVAHSYSCRR
jgi:hypothetical protein